jgi:hypothetical protein
MNLEMTATTWLACSVAIGLWAVSLLLTRDPAKPHSWNWRAIPLSLFGLAWVIVGITFFLRFPAVWYDPEFFRASQFPLWKLPATTFTWTWIALTLYWLAFVAGYFLIMHLSPPRPALLGKLDLLTSPENFLILDLLVGCCGSLIILSGRGFIPRALGTPLAILGGFYVIAATTVWFRYFQGQLLGLRRFFYLIPGLLIYFFSPFRALIFSTALCVLIPALKTRRWRSLTTFSLAMLALLIIATVVNDYRRARMRGDLNSRSETTLSNEALGWQEEPENAPWVRLSKRFHGFDALALTVHFVPSVFPYTQLNVFTDLIRRVIPRAVLDKKADTHRGRKFSTTIWAMGERGLVRRPEANISPSMCADLYQINGITVVIVGAMFYGLLVGLLESWQRRGSPLSSCVLLAVFGMPVVLGIEQEFNFATATLIQTVIGFFFLLFFLPLTSRLPETVRKLAAKKERV